MGALGKVCKEVPLPEAPFLPLPGGGADLRLAARSSEGSVKAEEPLQLWLGVWGASRGYWQGREGGRQVGGRPWSKGLRGWIPSSFCGFLSLG